MNAKTIYNFLATKYANHYFYSAEEFEGEINNMKYPCILVMPVITKQITVKSDRFNLTETAIVLSLAKMDLDFSSSVVYDSLSTLEVALLKFLGAYTDKIKSIQNVSELCKFSDNLIAAGFAIEFMNDPFC